MDSSSDVKSSTKSVSSSSIANNDIENSNVSSGSAFKNLHNSSSNNNNSNSLLPPPLTTAIPLSQNNAQDDSDFDEESVPLLHLSQLNSNNNSNSSTNSNSTTNSSSNIKLQRQQKKRRERAQRLQAERTAGTQPTQASANQQNDINSKSNYGSSNDLISNAISSATVTVTGAIGVSTAPTSNFKLKTSHMNNSTITSADAATIALNNCSITSGTNNRIDNIINDAVTTNGNSNISLNSFGNNNNNNSNSKVTISNCNNSSSSTTTSSTSASILLPAPNTIHNNTTSSNDLVMLQTPASILANQLLHPQPISLNTGVVGMEEDDEDDESVDEDLLSTSSSSTLLLPREKIQTTRPMPIRNSLIGARKNQSTPIKNLGFINPDSPVLEEDIIDGFSILAFKSYEDLEYAVKFAQKKKEKRLSALEELTTTYCIDEKSPKIIELGPHNNNREKDMRDREREWNDFHNHNNNIIQQQNHLLVNNQNSNNNNSNSNSNNNFAIVTTTSTSTTATTTTNINNSNNNIDNDSNINNDNDNNSNSNNNNSNNTDHNSINNDSTDKTNQISVNVNDSDNINGVNNNTGSNVNSINNLNLMLNSANCNSNSNSNNINSVNNSVNSSNPNIGVNNNNYSKSNSNNSTSNNVNSINNINNNLNNKITSKNNNGNNINNNSALPQASTVLNHNLSRSLQASTQDIGTSDDSGRASERLTASSVAPRDTDCSRDRLSDASSRCSSEKGYICDSEGDDDKVSDGGSVVFSSTPTQITSNATPSPTASRKSSDFQATAISISNGPLGETTSPIPAPPQTTVPGTASTALPPPIVPPPYSTQMQVANGPITTQLSQVSASPTTTTCNLPKLIHNVSTTSCIVNSITSTNTTSTLPPSHFNQAHSVSTLVADISGSQTSCSSATLTTTGISTTSTLPQSSSSQSNSTKQITTNVSHTSTVSHPPQFVGTVANLACSPLTSLANGFPVSMPPTITTSHPITSSRISTTSPHTATCMTLTSTTNSNHILSTGSIVNGSIHTPSNTNSSAVSLVTSLATTSTSAPSIIAPGQVIQQQLDISLPISQNNATIANLCSLPTIQSSQVFEDGTTSSHQQNPVVHNGSNLPPTPYRNPYPSYPLYTPYGDYRHNPYLPPSVPSPSASPLKIDARSVTNANSSRCDPSLIPKSTVRPLTPSNNTLSVSSNISSNLSNNNSSNNNNQNNINNNSGNSNNNININNNNINNNNINNNNNNNINNNNNNNINNNNNNINNNNNNINNNNNNININNNSNGHNVLNNNSNVGNVSAGLPPHLTSSSMSHIAPVLRDHHSSMHHVNNSQIQHSQVLYSQSQRSQIHQHQHLQPSITMQSSTGHYPAVTSSQNTLSLSSVSSVIPRTHSPRGHSPNRERESYGSSVSSLSRSSNTPSTGIPYSSAPTGPSPSLPYSTSTHATTNSSPLPPTSGSISSLHYSKSAGWCSATSTPPVITNSVTRPTPPPASCVSISPHHSISTVPSSSITTSSTASHTSFQQTIFATPLPPTAPVVSSTSAAPAPHPFSAESLLNNKTDQADLLRRELDSRFLDRSGLAVQPGPYLRQELHHHQHQHTHLHQHQQIMPTAPPSATTLFPPPLFKDLPKIGADSPFYRTGLGIPAYPGYSQSLFHSAGLGGPTPFVPPSHLPSFAPKQQNPIADPIKPQIMKTGRWNAMHVRIAWQIYKDQNEKQNSEKTSNSSTTAATVTSSSLNPVTNSLKPSTSAMDMLRPSTHMFPSSTSSLSNLSRPHELSSAPYPATLPGRSPYDTAPLPPTLFGAGHLASPFTRYGPPPFSSPFTLSPFTRDIPIGTPLHDPWRSSLSRTVAGYSPIPGQPSWPALKPDPAIDAARREAEEREREREIREREHRERERQRQREREERERKEKEEKLKREQQEREARERERERKERERREIERREIAERERMLQQQRLNESTKLAQAQAAAAAARERSPLRNGTDPNDIRIKEEIPRKEDQELLMRSAVAAAAAAADPRYHQSSAALAVAQAQAHHQFMTSRHGPHVLPPPPHLSRSIMGGPSMGGPPLTHFGPPTGHPGWSLDPYRDPYGQMLRYNPLMEVIRVEEERKALSMHAAYSAAMRGKEPSPVPPPGGSSQPPPQHRMSGMNVMQTGPPNQPGMGPSQNPTSQSLKSGPSSISSMQHGIPQHSMAVSVDIHKKDDSSNR